MRRTATGPSAPNRCSTREESGAALVLALLVTLLAVSLGLGILALATAQLRQAANQRDAAVALNAAEAGLNLALDLLSQGEDLPEAGLGPTSLNPGVTYRVAITSDQTDKKRRTLQLTAEGSAGKAHRTVVANVLVDGKHHDVTLLTWREGY